MYITLYHTNNFRDGSRQENKGFDIRKFCPETPCFEALEFQIRGGDEDEVWGREVEQTTKAGAILTLSCIKPRRFCTRLPYVKIFFRSPLTTLNV
jgi:hypothetical protein